MTPAADDEPTANPPPRLLRVRIRGFRSYGTEARELDLDSAITVIKGDNSQGKTATAEALEFLFTGTSSRRDLFGGAKAEYERMLANVHLPTDDQDVWVEADVRCRDGEVRTVRRSLTVDFSGSADCVSALAVDGQAASNLDSLGIPFSDPPLAAPVLLQHNLRYVLSTEPQKRAAYFRALLELTDLDIVRDAVERGKDRIAGLGPLPWVASLSSLRAKAQGNPAAATALRNAADATDHAFLMEHLASAVKALTPAATGSSADELIASLHEIKAQAEEKVFPIGALSPSLTAIPAPVDPARLGRGVDTYIGRLREVDVDVARMAPLLDAVVHHPQLGILSEPTTCPVCNDGTLRPERIVRLRQQLAASGDVQEAAASIISELQFALREVDRVGVSLKSVLPPLRLGMRTSGRKLQRIARRSMSATWMRWRWTPKILFGERFLARPRPSSDSERSEAW
jgi:hypothetical protein